MTRSDKRLHYVAFAEQLGVPDMGSSHMEPSSCSNCYRDPKKGIPH